MIRHLGKLFARGRFVADAPSPYKGEEGEAGRRPSGPPTEARSQDWEKVAPDPERRVNQLRPLRSPRGASEASK